MGTRSFRLRSGVLCASSLAALAFILGAAVTAHPAQVEVSPSPALGPALWVANDDTSYVSEFTGHGLTGIDRQSPSRVLKSPDLDCPWGLIFDSAKNLWVSNVCSGTLTKFTSKQLKGLKTNDAPSAAVKISGLDRPEGMVFDKYGDMWLADENNKELYEFTSSQLASGGSPNPHMTISSSDFCSPVGIAFDSKGDLWVADDCASELFKFTKAQLAAGGKQTPTVVLSSDVSDSLDSCEPILFDKSGNLWVANNAGSIVKFSPSQLKSSGSPTPVVTLKPVVVTGTSADSLDVPAGITFDSEGNLWVGNADSDEYGSVAQFSKSSIGASGSPQPLAFIDSTSNKSNLGAPLFLIFGPKVP
ncbi:MAG TPA: hypothetical protein VEC38_10920 [Candidatus Binataceae bacterium]|nr:hypothetical protein [Candidatus Binataceae bacterium]